MFPGFKPQNHPHQQATRGALDSVDDRETPPDVFDPLNAEFRFTLDVAASKQNAKCARFYAKSPEETVFTRAQGALWQAKMAELGALGFDGLSYEWARNEIVWCNPPFSDIAPWVQKAHESACTVVMLLPANRTEQPWWQRYVEPYRDKRLGVVSTRFLAGRRSFMHHGERIGNSTSKAPPFGVVVVIWDRRSAPGMGT